MARAPAASSRKGSACGPASPPSESWLALSWWCAYSRRMRVAGATMNAFVGERRLRGAACAAALAVVLLLSAPFTTCLLAQTSPSGSVPSPAATAPAPAPPPSDSGFRPGFVHQLQDWWDRSRDWLNGKSKNANASVPVNADAKAGDAKS